MIQKSHPAIVAVSGLDHPPGGFLFPEWVAFFTGIRTEPGTPAFAIHQHTYWTAGQLSGLVAAFGELPDRVDLDFAEPAGRASCVHASLLGNRDGIYPETDDAELAAKVDGGARLFAVGHTHRPLIRDLGGTLVVNVGSVGLPFDGDRRAGYACAVERLAGHHLPPRLRLAAHARRLRCAGVHRGSGAVARIICRELEIAQSPVGQVDVPFRGADPVRPDLR